MCVGGLRLCELGVCVEVILECVSWVCVGGLRLCELGVCVEVILDCVSWVCVCRWS